MFTRLTPVKLLLVAACVHLSVSLAAPVRAFTINGAFAASDFTIQSWGPGTYGVSGGAQAVQCSLFLWADVEDYDIPSQLFTSIVATIGTRQYSPAGGVQSIKYTKTSYEVLSAVNTSSSGTVYGAPTAADLVKCGFSGARSLVAAGPSSTIIGSDVRDFDGGFYFGFKFDDADGTEHECTIGWTDGWGSDLVNQCVPAPDTTVEDTERAITSFMLGRANQLTSNQPRLTRFLRGDGCGTFNASGTDAGGSLNGCASQGNVWSEITASWGNGSSYALGTIGAHQYINENFLLGGMVQFDRATDDRNNARGTGWMVGPYFAAKMAEQPLYFEGRLLYGQTKNKLTPIGTYTDSFETKRWLAQLRAEGEIQQETITWIPLLDFTHTRDRSKSYTDSLGNVIGSQSVALTQLTSGLDFRMPLQSDTGTLELTGGASAIYSSTKGGSADFENGRGRVHMGLNWDSGQGTTVRAGAFYDGIGARHRSVGGNLGVDIHF